MTEHEIDVHADVTISVDTFGEAGDPSIVLLSAAADQARDSGQPWSDALCERLAAGLRFVIRYAGRSSNDDPVGDMVALFDALELARAHLVARPDTATLAQVVADQHPDRIASVIVVASPPEVANADEPVVETTTPTYVVAGTDDALVAAILRHTSGGWQQQADRLANRSLAQDNPTAWFDRLYAAASTGEVEMPWDRDEPNPVLVGWARDSAAEGAGRRALVVGAGLGRDAEFVATLGFRTTAFDVSPAAIANVHARYPDSTVDYHVANLLDPPAEWVNAFDLVVESYTVQAMPRSVRQRATANVGAFVAPGGTLVVIQAYAGAADEHGPPWPPTRVEIDAFAVGALVAERVTVLDGPSGRRWLAEFRRPG
jgi:pimeloyl-ACP methyl ester carboxylesterase